MKTILRIFNTISRQYPKVRHWIAVNRLAHFLAGLFSGYLLWIKPVAGISLAVLFNFEQITNEYAESNPPDFDNDVWDFMFFAFIGAGIGFIQYWFLRS